jgi:hypothetical protein
MRQLYAATSHKSYGVIAAVLADAASRRAAMVETYSAVWRRRNERAGMSRDHLIWVLAIARWHALDFRTDHDDISTQDTMQTPTSILALTPSPSGVPQYAGAGLSPGEQALLVDAYIRGEPETTLQARYNLKTGQLLPELHRIIRQIRKRAK